MTSDPGHPGDGPQTPRSRAADTGAGAGHEDPSPPTDPNLAGEPRRAAAEMAIRADRIRTLSEDLRSTKAELRRVKQEHAALRRRRSVRMAMAISNRVAPVVILGRRFGSRVQRALPGSLRATRMGEPQKRLRPTIAEESAFLERLSAALEPSATTSGPLVSIVVLTRDGIDHLRRLLPALDGLAYGDFEVIVVDNGSRDASVEYVRSLTPRYPIDVIENDINESFSVANNQGVAKARGELILLLNNDTEPAGPHVLGHMVERLVGEPEVVAVASRLIYPKREGPTMGAASRPADLTLQHRGIAFVTENGVQTPRNLGGGEDPLGPAASARCEVQLATAACLLLRRSALAAVDGLSPDYDYGMEDIDLCLNLRAHGGRIAYEPQATFWHHESATQRVEDPESRLARRMANRAVLADRWGPRIAREALLDRLSGTKGWSAEPLHVGITLTRDDPAAGWGDWYTAHELGDALEGIGWRVTYLERWQDRWYEPDPSLDVVLSLLDAIDVRRLPEGVVRIAWVRNWTERWLGQPWFDEYDIVLASSGRSKELIDAGSVHAAILMPLATNPARFHPPESPAAPAVDVAFTANRWGQERGVESLVPRLTAGGHSVAVYGMGWDAVPAMAGVARGSLAYGDLPAAYASAALVVDDTAAPTLPYGAVNSRVFDALATGTLVITDNVAGAHELFGDALPAAADQVGLVGLAERYLADPDGRRQLTDDLRAVVLERHTYPRRAEELRGILLDWATAIRLDVSVGPPGWDVAATWGDYHFGRALQRALRRRGVRGRLRLRQDWDGPAASTADVALHVFGLAAPRTRPGQLSVLWIISHPDLVTDDVLGQQDVVFVASDGFADRLAKRTDRTVMPLHQATDPDRFKPVPGGPAHDLLFVANSRGVRRRVVDELTPTDRDLAVFGRGWTPELLDPRYLQADHVPNDELAAYYLAASIVLNDHWPDMAANGFLSNRLYDAAASGAFVVSDRVVGINTEFDDGIVTFKDGAELRSIATRFLDDQEARGPYATRARAAVLKQHTFGHRADEILRVIGPILATRLMRIDDGPTGAPPASRAGMR